ncbi:MAG: hypothetical protein IJW18_05855 [Lachnospiraceae bacterium]|nr:hypothetical protein [Lachnospiraceae bacterium]
MKKNILSTIIVTTLTLAISFTGFTGCNKADVPSDTSSAPTETTANTTTAPTSVTPQQPETTINSVKATDFANLEAILDSILTNIAAGTSGSSLRAAIVGATILDYSCTTTLSAAEVSAYISEWLANHTSDEKAIYIEQLNSASGACERLKSDTAIDLIDSAGITKSLYPWPSSNNDIVNAILQTTK